MAANPEIAAAADAADPNSLPEKLRRAIARLTNQQKAGLVLAVAAVIALVVGGAIWTRDSGYRVLFSNIDANGRDGGAIISALDQLQVPYRFNDRGSAILVPGEKVHEARLRLAAQGLPKGGAVGFELMESQKFGVSQFAEQVNYQRGLEGELSRTIQSIGSVQMARVHLAIPKPSVFVREEQKPTASVMLHLYSGRGLDQGQLAGITHLVASSVPQMPASNVAIIDQNGTLLSQIKNKPGEAGLDPTQLNYVRNVESSVIKRIEDILLPVAGAGNTRVQVAADIDFSQTEQTAETFRPNSTPTDLSIRSQQTSESVSGNPSATGVPGALSNQPPVPATAPLTSPAVPGQAPAPTGAPIPGQIQAAGVNAVIGNMGQPINARKDATINYEVDKTIRHVKSSLGSIKRLSVAVVVNHKKEVGKDGKPVTKPLSEPEIKQVNDLVKEAMGFSRERGDTLAVVNTPFTLDDRGDGGAPIWKDPETVASVKDLVKYLIIGGIALYLLLGVVRPLLRQMFPPGWLQERVGDGPRHGPGGTGAGAQNIVIEDEEDPELNMALATYEHKLEKARQIAADDPTVVANIVKDWISPNAPQ